MGSYSSLAAWHNSLRPCDWIGPVSLIYNCLSETRPTPAVPGVTFRIDLNPGSLQRYGFSLDTIALNTSIVLHSPVLQWGASQVYMKVSTHHAFTLLCLSCCRPFGGVLIYPAERTEISFFGHCFSCCF